MLRSIYMTSRFFSILGALTVVWVLVYFLPAWQFVARQALFVFIALVAVDSWLLYRVREGIEASRSLPERLSNGDANPIALRLRNRYLSASRLEIIDELPPQLQRRDLSITRTLPAGAGADIEYTIRPVKRGAYRFGRLFVYARSPIGLIARRFAFGEETVVPVYPSFLQMRGFEILAASNRLHEVGVKRIRRIGHTLEFERVREYVVGDDPRTVNWRATARRDQLMVNQYQDERSQPLYCLLDMGRVMRMPFEGLTLLDYSINASLVLANIALKKDDRVGLLTFSHQMGPMAPADRGARQLGILLERLYALKTDFLETDFERLYITVRRQVKQRSLLLLFTNFESKSALTRQMPYLRALGRAHLLVVIFFENTELDDLRVLKPVDIESIYLRTVAEQFAREKHEIVMELQRHGIQAIYTRPRDLSVNTLNKYLELKARGMA